MSQFAEFNGQNKLRIPLSAYAANTIEGDCLLFSKQKTTLINTIIHNFYQTADCSISLRLEDYRKELGKQKSKSDQNDNTRLIERIIDVKAKELKGKYAARRIADVNWQIALDKKAKYILTEDKNSSEENHYDKKPGRYVRALLEEYALQPSYLREKIVYKDIIDIAEFARKDEYLLDVTNNQKKHSSIKVYGVMTDSFSMYHYLVGIDTNLLRTKDKIEDAVVGRRISRLLSAEPQYFCSGELSDDEKATIFNQLSSKGVQFLSAEMKQVKIWLSDEGIKNYKSHAHLRPLVTKKDESDDHIYHFNCTDFQILLYFWKFGKEAIILEPPELAEKFKDKYKEAYESYICN